MDPQLRMLLEVAYEAILDSGKLRHCRIFRLRFVLEEIELTISPNYAQGGGLSFLSNNETGGSLHSSLLYGAPPCWQDTCAKMCP